MSKPVLLETGPMMGLISSQLAAVFTVHKLHEAADKEVLLAKIGPDVVAICTGGHTGVKTDAALQARFPKLKVIGNFGVGYDSIDVAAAAKRGIIVTNTPEVLTEEVADTALGLLLCTVREFGPAENYLRAGRWAKEGDYPLTKGSLRDRKLGMVGMGRIGQAIARRVEAFGVPVVYYSRSKKANVPKGSRHPNGDHAGRRRDQEHDQCRCPRGAWVARHPHQRGAGLGRRRASADGGAAQWHDPGSRP
jgi:lactate dehydrogenase-like 2-hydroxyacid dehydrogenase